MNWNKQTELDRVVMDGFLCHIQLIRPGNLIGSLVFSLSIEDEDLSYLRR
jgi:hypothetical protein